MTAHAPGTSSPIIKVRRGRRIGGASIDGSSDRGVARFTRVRLARTGVAAFIADYGPQHDRVVVDTDGGFYARDARLDGAFLRLAGSTVAWRVGSTYETSALDGERQTPSGTLLELGRVRVEAVVSRFRTELRGRVGRHPGVPLGEPTSVCMSSSGCSGIEALQRAGRFVATPPARRSAGLGP